MYARMNTTRWYPEKREEAEKLTWDTIIPSYRNQQGFKGYYLLTEPGGEKAVAVTLWDSESDMEASAAVARSLIPKLKDYIVEPPVTEQFEVTIFAE
jgi:heme-degrading monooxygenase HmoA